MTKKQEANAAFREAWQREFAISRDKIAADMAGHRAKKEFMEGSKREGLADRVLHR